MPLIKIIFLTIFLPLLLVIVAYGQMYDTQGKIFGKRAQETMQPKTIIDTVSIVAGWGSIDLNDNFTQGQHNVAPTNENTIYVTITPMLTDSTKTAYYYGWWFDKTKNRIGVKSSGGTADTGKVVITAIVK